MYFRDIIGHQAVKEQLIRGVSGGRIPHAQMLLGPEGCGALPLAIAYARYISCENRGDTDACGTCHSCNKYNKLAHPDLHFVFPVASSKKKDKDPVSDDYIDEWRQAVQQTPYMKVNQWYEAMGIENKQGSISKNESREILRKLGLKSFESEYKVMIIWLPEKMNQVAANKLLKILEEPQGQTVFLLVSENTEEILPTILSRTQVTRLSKIDTPSLLQHLRSRFAISEADALSLIRITDGCYPDILASFEAGTETDWMFEQYMALMRLSYSFNVPEMTDWAEKMATNGREKQKRFLSYALRQTRENLMLNLGEPSLAFLSGMELEFSQKFHRFISFNNAPAISEEFSKAIYDVERNGNGKMIFTDLTLKMHILLKRN